MSRRYDVTGPIRDGLRSGPYRQYVHDTRDTDDTLGRRLRTLIKTARLEREWTQDYLADLASVSRQTVMRYESGSAEAPRPNELRAVCAALEIDFRDMVIALGYITREEIGMPPRPSAVPLLLRDIARVLNAPEIAEADKAALLAMIEANFTFWSGVIQRQPSPAEPSAKQRAAGRRVRAES